MTDGVGWSGVENIWAGIPSIEFIATNCLAEAYAAAS